MLSRLLLALAGALTLATPAAAADPARMFHALPDARCGTPLTTTGKAITFKEPVDDATRRGLMAGLFLTLYDPTGAGRPKADVEAAQACPIAKFAAKDLVWTIYSGAGGAPLRVIVAPGRTDSFILVRGPALADAELWSRSRQGLPSASTAPAYYLVALAGERQHLIQIYDGPPPMERLAEDAAAAVEGRDAPIAAYQPSGATVNLRLETRDGASAELFRPSDIKDGEPAILFYPDGRLIRDGEKSGFTFRGSGFACPTEYGAFKLDRFYVYDARDESLELGCRLDTEKSVTVIYVIRRPDAAGDKAYWTENIAFNEKQFGVGKKLSNPPTGPKATIQAGRNWIDKDGMEQVDFFLRRGEYLYEIRQSHTVEDLDPASKTLLALFEQIDASQSGIDAWRRARDRP